MNPPPDSSFLRLLDLCAKVIIAATLIAGTVKVLSFFI